MGICNNCKKKIMYNKYKRYRKTILCLECYDTRLERKAAKKAKIKGQAESVKIVTPTKKAKKAMKKKGISYEAQDLGLNADDENEKAEDSN